MGKVYLIGAGCGAYDLVTVKGMRLLKQADCVLYDRLIDPQLLSMVPFHAETIDVGKQDHRHTMPQKEIEALLVEKAKQYDCVIRLKGGDPYVFGRGGEEAMALHQAKVPFEVVPGISSCIASLTYAGFPITQRGINRGFRVYSAHTKEDTLSDLDYASMAESQDTFVFLMGRKHQRELFNQLLTHGKKETTPVALISNAGRYNQRVVISTLKAAYKQEIPMESPCTIVVGDVISLKDQMSFFEELPLLGKRILMPSLTKEIQGDMLRDQGAMVEEVQVGVIKEASHALDAIDLSRYTYLLLTSAHGVHSFLHQLLEGGKDTRSLYGIRIASIGAKTTEALLQYGLHADITAEKSDSVHMAQQLRTILKKEDQILIAKADNDNDTLQTMLHDYHVTMIPLYHSETIPFTTQYETYDAIIFTSAFHVHACKDILHQTDMCFSIGPHTTKALKEANIKNIIESEQADKQTLIKLVRKEFSKCIEEED